MVFNFVNVDESLSIKEAITKCVYNFASRVHTMVDYDNIIEDLSKARDSKILTEEEYSIYITVVNSVQLYV